MKSSYLERLKKVPKWWFIIIVLGIWLIIDIYEKPKPIDTRLVTIYIPSKISDDVLAVTLPRCALKINEERFKKNDFEADSLTLIYDYYAYSGNLKNEFSCSKNKDIAHPNDIRPIYPFPIPNGRDSGVKFLRSLNDAVGSKILQKNQYVERRISTPTHELLLIDGMKNQTTPFQVQYVTFDGSFNHAPSYVYDVETVIHDKFLFEYSFFILVPENRNKHDLADYNTDFAEKFRDVIQSQGDLLKDMTLVQGFVDNNERVVKFINDHSKIIKKHELKKIMAKP